MEDEVHEETEIEEDEEDLNEAYNPNTTREVNTTTKISYAYSQKEFLQIFDRVEKRMMEVRRGLKLSDFEVIAAWRNAEFVGKWVEEGEELANGKLATFSYAYPERKGNSLHSFCTKKSSKGDSYDHLLANWTRIWAGADAMTVNEADESDESDEDKDDEDEDDEDETDEDEDEA
jgi:hypothetical protein